MSERVFALDKIYGTDNTSDLAVVGQFKQGNGMYFYEIDNVDIDNDNKTHLRRGYGSAVMAGSAIRSLWANKDICMYLDGTNFYRLDENYARTLLLSGVNAEENFCYVDHGFYVYFSNSAIIGYVDTRTFLSYPFPNETRTYKKKMVGGQCLEWYRGRLYAAHNKNLYFSDADTPMSMDARKNAVAYDSRITMVKAVDDGIYVSSSSGVYFLYGTGPFDFVEVKKLSSPAIEGMSAAYVRDGSRQSEKIIYWLSEDGYIYTGRNQGLVVIAAQGLFQASGVSAGTAYVDNTLYEQLIMLWR